MKKRLSLILCLVMVIGIIPTSIIGSYSESPINPFAAQDKARDKGLSAAIQEFIPRDKNAKNKADAGSKGEKNSAVENGQRFIVKFKESTPFNEIYDLLVPLQYKLIGNSKHRLFCIENTSLDDLQKSMGDQVDYIEIDHVSKLDPISAKRDFVEQDGVSKQKSITTNDPRLSEQWALDNTQIKDAWGVTTGGTDVLVAVIDSGIYRDHEDFALANISNGRDYILNQEYVDRDSNGHGTMVTGIIAATTNNNKGIAGVCWKVTIIPYLISYPDGTAFNSDIAGALHDAADAGVDVINISFGGSFSFVEQSATSYAASKGCIVVAAAGNDGTIAYSYPASYPGVISAASIDESSSRSYFSNYNNKIDVSAPGENILTTSYSDYSDYDYDRVNGTSFSSPYVAGIAALARSLDHTIDVYDFRDILKNTSTDKGKVGYDYYYGHGIINAKKIVDYLNSSVIPNITTRVGSSAIINNENHFIYGIGEKTGRTVFESNYIKINSNTKLVYTPDVERLGTGTAVHVVNRTTNEVFATYIIIVFGDISGDGTVSTSDALAVLRACSGSVTLDEPQLFAGDVNQSKSLTTSDALAILKYVSGSIAGF